MPDGISIPEILSIRCRYADVALDAAWALFEIRQRRDPARLPNDTWTDITSTWLGIARHPSGRGGLCAASWCRTRAACPTTRSAPC
ncbi:MAG: hypothetical protein U0838_13850 [Chloroflexota bacterium]